MIHARHEAPCRCWRDVSGSTGFSILLGHPKHCSHANGREEVIPTGSSTLTHRPIAAW
jgi:hypothetical protein